ncbi:MerR family transcriptional regulator [Leucobacter coleopterorum]|uniref:MerR family transcriptional regulator n=1 Tax=Leucobacter coleopterorum TaxID=2714933 RepID=A0ABX6K2W7_9MICO|nr:TipAS antibiotic-recognition domain-containing protein [Leucobacter coleopterorum]QIM19484.1 MerR family transcriptional regulator [Leucobacter coleopterorum]
MERSIQEVAQAAGTTSRTLRHYDRIGLVTPSRIGSNGYRYYDDRALVRLQRVLLLRNLGLGLEAIGQVLVAQDRAAVQDRADSAGGAPEQAEARILADHLELLRQERERIDTQIGAVERTIAALQRNSAQHSQSNTEKEDLMAQDMFEGFDHTQCREEVEERWGADAYAKGDQWWRSLGAEGQDEWREKLAALNADWIAAAARGDDPESATAQRLAKRHVEWLTATPGTPASVPGGDLAGYLLGLGEMYVADQRFAANYGGVEGAAFVRDALAVYVERELS